LLLFILIIFTKLTIRVNYFHYNDNDDLKLELRIWFGLIRYKKHIPLIKIDDNSPSIIVKSASPKQQPKEKSSEKEVHQITPNKIMTSLKNTREIIKHVIDLHVVVRKFFNRVSVKELEWHTIIGVGDAAITGMVTGGIWAIKGSIIGLISRYIKLKEMPDISVTPYFQQAIIQTRFTCIFQFRIGYAILAGIKMIKFWKGGRPNLKTKTNFSKEKTNSV
jgi:hypothetical protein